MTQRPIHQIAREIRADWKNVNYAAAPYLDAMLSLTHVNERYIAEDGKSIILYFLGNATTWHGAKAREIKAELNAMIKR